MVPPVPPALTLINSVFCPPQRMSVILAGNSDYLSKRLLFFIGYCRLSVYLGWEMCYLCTADKCQPANGDSQRIGTKAVGGRAVTSRDPNAVVLR